MKLADMFLNKVGSKQGVGQISKAQNEKADFNKYLSDEQDKYTQNHDKKEIHNKKDMFDEKHINDKKNVPKDEDVPKEQIDTSQDEKNIVKNSETDKKADINKENDAKLENAIKDISKILDISEKEVINMLKTLNLDISMLVEPQNMLSFIKEALNIEDNTALLLVDGAKDMMKDIEKIANELSKNANELSKSANELSKNANDTLKNLMQNNTSDKSMLKDSTKAMLDELNGKVVDTKIAKEDIASISSKQDSKMSFGQNTEQNMAKNILNIKEKIMLDKDIEGNMNISELQGSKISNITLPKTKSLININNTSTINQILEKMKTSIKPDMTEIKILLRPESLGEVSLKIATRNGIVTAQFMAENQKVKELIESNFTDLKNVLQEKGIDIGELNVDINGNGQNEQAYQKDDGDNNKNIKKILEKIEEDIEENDKEISKEIKDIDSSVSYSI